MSDDSSSGKGEDGTENFVACDCSCPRRTVAAATTDQQETPLVEENGPIGKAKRLSGCWKKIKEWKRKRNLKMLQQDKLVRETDPNWMPGVSAACANIGIILLTFRDRNGKVTAN
jgi:hypothetical protein